MTTTETRTEAQRLAAWEAAREEAGLNLSVSGAIDWLDRQYSRHKELEDKLAADHLRRLEAENARLRLLIGHQAMDDAAGIKS